MFSLAGTWFLHLILFSSDIIRVMSAIDFDQRKVTATAPETTPPTPIIFEFYRRRHSSTTKRMPFLTSTLTTSTSTEYPATTDDDDITTKKFVWATTDSFVNENPVSSLITLPSRNSSESTEITKFKVNDNDDVTTSTMSQISLLERRGNSDTTALEPETSTEPTYTTTTSAQEENKAKTKSVQTSRSCFSFYCKKRRQPTLEPRMTATRPMITRQSITIKPVNVTPKPSAKVSHPSPQKQTFSAMNSSASMEGLVWSKFENSFWNVTNEDLEHRTSIFMDNVESLYKSGKVTHEVIQNATHRMESILTESHVLISSLRKFLVQQETSFKLVDFGRPAKKVVGYYTAWGAKVATDLMLSHLTHLVFAFPDFNVTGELKLNPVAATRLRHIISLRSKVPELKIMISVGGWGTAHCFSSIVRNKSFYKRFSKDLFVLFRKYGFDGVDIDWEYPNDDEEKSMFVVLMRKIRQLLDEWKKTLGKKDMILTFAGAAGAENIDKFDLPALLDTDIVDWVNVMTYDFYGPWDNPNGLLTGPPSPLFCAVPQFGYSRKLNVNWTIQKYLCKIKSHHKLVMGVPFFGRYWENVGPPTATDPMWRKVDGNSSSGGVKNFYEINEYISSGFVANFSEQAVASYAWNERTKTYLGFECPKSIQTKIAYIKKHNLGGVMIWAVDLDDRNLTMLQTVTGKTAHVDLPEDKFECVDTRWWVATNRTGMCGKMAPLLNGSYPVCDPENPTASCCGQWGYCGSGAEFCDCPSCVDYSKFPAKITVDSRVPKYEVLWHNMESPSFGLCGRNAPRINDSFAICNPENENGHCCSEAGFCGTGQGFCECTNCVDFQKRPEFRYRLVDGPKTWWSWQDFEGNAGKCGPDAPKVNGTEATCDPSSPNAFCCSAFGFCGSGEPFCDCPTCKNYANM